MDRARRNVTHSTAPPPVPHQAADPEGTRSPILTGDTVEGRRVLGFTCTALSAPTSADDQLLLSGDADAAFPPQRSTNPAYQPTLERTGRRPDEQFDALARAYQADDLGAVLADRFHDLLHGPHALPFTGDLIEHLAAAGHHTWVSGGAPRDLLMGAAPDEINDLDLTGTAPAGTFTETSRRVLDLEGVSAEHPQRFNPDTLTCTVLDPIARTAGASLDYRGLGLGLAGSNYRATGTDLLQDSLQRDLTVNTLLYDPLRSRLVDPLGKALDDLADDQGQRRLVPVNTSTDPLVRAEVLLRGLKFLLRWHTHDLDEEPLRVWTQSLPADLLTQLDQRGEETWHRLRMLWSQCVPDATAPEVTETLRRLGTVATQLAARCEGGRG
ncbi:hypothetical protein OG800_07880 [Streptomyces sp. NBC_00445]|uniref:hypothetical protein n=1 Tax=Streptomyces sp. NBC_00445 TaxID=2975745 RepID=UPI002E1AC1E4